MAPLMDFLSQFWSIVWTTSVRFLVAGCEVLHTSPWLYVHAVDLLLAATDLPLTVPDLPLTAADLSLAVCWSHRPSLCYCESRGLPLASSFVCYCVYGSYSGFHCHSSCFYYYVLRVQQPHLPLFLQTLCVLRVPLPSRKTLAPPPCWLVLSPCCLCCLCLPFLEGFFYCSDLQFSFGQFVFGCLHQLWMWSSLEKQST